MPGSERDWVRWLRHAAARRGERVRLGIGDDAAILRLRAGEDAAVTTDLFLEGVHFLRHERAADCGYRCASRALSDLAAMGARPVALFVSLALPRRPAPATATWGRGFFRGLLSAADQAGAALAGGDLAAAPAGIVADVAGFGAVPRGRALTRSGARPGDRIFVSGRLGLAAQGRQWALGGANRAARPNSAAVTRHRLPRARWELGLALATRRLASAAMDISDGLSLDLARLCAASGAGAVLDAAHIPRPAGPDGLRLALAGGEDYELLFTVPAGRAAEARRLRAGGIGVTDIGGIRGTAGLWLQDAAGRKRRLRPAGWDHFG